VEEAFSGHMETGVFAWLDDLQAVRARNPTPDGPATRLAGVTEGRLS
jgi:hypothetical protein